MVRLSWSIRTSTVPTDVANTCFTLFRSALPSRIEHPSGVHSRRAPAGGGATPAPRAPPRGNLPPLPARAYRLRALLEPVVGLVGLLERQHAEGDGDPRLERRELEAGRGLARDEVEVRRIAADDAAECDDARVAARLRQCHRRDRQLERAGDGHHRDRIARDARRVELSERSLEQLARDGAVEAADDDADGATPALGSPCEDAVPIGDAELAGGVLGRIRLGGLFLHLGLGNLFGVGNLIDRGHVLDLVLDFFDLDAATDDAVVAAGWPVELGRLRPALAHASAPS